MGVKGLGELSPEERQELYKMLDLTVEAYHNGKLEVAWALNASVSKIRRQSGPPCGLCP
jgi:hypothetical protein